MPEVKAMEPSSVNLAAVDMTHESYHSRDVAVLIVITLEKKEQITKEREL